MYLLDELTDQHIEIWILQLSYPKFVHPSTMLIGGKICMCPCESLAYLELQWAEKLIPNNMLKRTSFWIGFMCTHISWDLLFHLEGLRTLKESWEKLESLFGKQDELRGNILENELITLQPSSFKSIQEFFTKYKSLVMQCKKCGLERKDEKLVLSLLS